MHFNKLFEKYELDFVVIFNFKKHIRQKCRKAEYRSAIIPSPFKKKIP
jgi:hypothetical protein